MLADFRQKQQIITHIAQHRNWHNEFDMDFVIDPKRKVKSQRINDLAVSLYLYDSIINVEHSSLDISIEIRRIVDGVGLRLPDGRIVMLTKAMQPHSNYKKIKLGAFNPQAESYARIQDFMIAIDGSGVIDIQLPELNQSILIQPLRTPRPRLLKQGLFFHRISFNHHSHGKKWGLEPTALLMAAKLIIARELGIEPDLQAINIFDQDRFVDYLNDTPMYQKDLSAGMPPQWSPTIETPVSETAFKALQKAWSDSTDFEGYRIETPRLFCVRKGDKGYDFYVGLDHKQQLITLGHVTLKALKHTQRDNRVFGDKENLSTLLHVLEHGLETKDPEGKLWRYTYIPHEMAPAFAQKLRQKCHDTYLIDRQDMLILAVAPNQCLLMMRETCIEPIKAAYAASMALAKMLDGQSDDMDLFKAYLAQGADIRYLDREIGKIENKAFLQALRL